ncbi:MAG: vWA domain-containing protein [Pirellulaceae bacterium]
MSSMTQDPRKPFSPKKRFRLIGGRVSSLTAWGASTFALLLFSGCGDNVSLRNPFADPQAKTKPAQPTPTAQQKPTPRQRTASASNEQRARQSMMRTSSVRSGGGGFGSSSVADRPNLSQMVDRLKTEIDSSVDFAPTLVIWMVDSTQSASDLRRDLAAAVKGLYGEFQTKGFPSGDKSADILKTAIVAFGEKPEFVLETPTEDYAQVIEKFGSLPSDGSGKENTFAALQQVIDKYSGEGRETLIILATDEAGDDANQVDATIAKATAAGVRIHAIGIPAPFGLERAPGSTSESRQDGMPVLVQGPETRSPQLLKMKFTSGGFGAEELDSGYGPFGLNYLTRATSGSYLIPRDVSSGGWPGNAPRFDEKVMQRYPPQYISQQEYQQLLASNKAAQALHLVSQRAEIEAMVYPATQFIVAEEARLKNDLDNAQRTAARLGPLVDSVYTPLDEAEKDRDNLSDRRMQAAFDLALGRAAAAKGRVDGYNQMLAILKGGRKFENPDNDTWYLEPANTLEEAGSRLEKVREQAEAALKRVIEQHPGTPWAQLAEKELETPIGWKWVEN